MKPSRLLQSECSSSPVTKMKSSKLFDRKSDGSDSTQAACLQFEKIMFRWRRFAGRCIGSDILDPNFRITVLTVIAMASGSFYPIHYISTICTYEGEVATKAAGMIAIAFKVISTFPIYK